MPECGLFLGLDTHVTWLCFLFTRRCSVHTQVLGSSSLTHTPTDCEKLLQRVMGRAPGAWSVCRTCRTSLLALLRGSGGGVMRSLKRGWDLNVYLKYIQKEVTVSLSCAGFNNSPFSISHVRKMFLLLVTAQCTIFMYYSITAMQINHRNVYI